MKKEEGEKKSKTDLDGDPVEDGYPDDRAELREGPVGHVAVDGEELVEHTHQQALVGVGRTLGPAQLELHLPVLHPAMMTFMMVIVMTEIIMMKKHC